MDGTALVFCEGAFGRPEGKTANGLVRFGQRYDVLGVIDSSHAGRDAGDVIAGVTRKVPIFSSLHQAVEALHRQPEFLVFGLNPADGRLPPEHRRVVREALRLGISVDSPLRPFLHEDAEFPGLAMQSSARLRSVGYPKPLGQLRAHTGAIADVRAFRIAVVGTHSVVGKRTTAVRLTERLGALGLNAEMIGTGQTSWLQGVRSTVILSSILSGYVAGELEGAIVDAWSKYRPAVMVLEGQGSVLNRANPSGLELLTTARPDAIVMQHAPTHSSIAADDPYGIGTLERHIRVAELLSGARVVAITVNPDGTDETNVKIATERFLDRFGLLVVDVLRDPSDSLARHVADLLGTSRSHGA